jgi:Ni,Fe-hydrogenase III component G
MSTPDYTTLLQIGLRWGIPIYRPGQTQLQFLIRVPENLRLFCIQLHEMGYYLVTMVANDERELEDHCFKIYHLFSHPTDNLFVTLEYSIRVGQETYPSIIDIYPAAEVFEREIADLFGLLSEQEQPGMPYQSYMHNNYPEGCIPYGGTGARKRIKNSQRNAACCFNFGGTGTNRYVTRGRVVFSRLAQFTRE